MIKDESNREKILNVAADVFALHGFEGARMDQIAKKANVNKATIYYNIGNKQVLYEEVLNGILKFGLKSFNKAMADLETPQEKLAAYIQNLANTFKNNPLIAIMIMREQVSEGKNLPDSFTKNIMEVLSILDSILKQGKEADIFEEADTLTIHFMIMSTLMFYITSAPIRRQKKAFAEKFRPQDDDPLAGVTEKITKYILKAVCKGN
ncbi:MAG: TetR/AcrR family transcriptional regulator [Desulfobacteraceae bacterium]|nr:TetR/AcrR family transcriptional regulator [Desulfobacteraceae bacterium]